MILIIGTKSFRLKFPGSCSLSDAAKVREDCGIANGNEQRGAHILTENEKVLVSVKNDFAKHVSMTRKERMDE
jgi:hypothetical protein